MSTSPVASSVASSESPVAFFFDDAGACDDDGVFSGFAPLVVKGAFVCVVCVYAMWVFGHDVFHGVYGVCVCGSVYGGDDECGGGVCFDVVVDEDVVGVCGGFVYEFFHEYGPLERESEYVVQVLY